MHGKRTAADVHWHTAACVAGQAGGVTTSHRTYWEALATARKLAVEAQPAGGSITDAAALPHVADLARYLIWDRAGALVVTVALWACRLQAPWCAGPAESPQPSVAVAAAA